MPARFAAISKSQLGCSVCTALTKMPVSTTPAIKQATTMATAHL
jgi:hypothetical protein